MHDIEMHEPTEEFARCWQAAGRHLESCSQGGLSWLKADLTPPFLEHLSFRMGNQLFFIRIADVDGRLVTPGNSKGAQDIAEGCNGHACVMPMRRKLGKWRPDAPGWGLVDAQTGRSIDPVALVTDEKIVMTDWELHDFAVQVVRDHVRSELGHQIMSSQGNPDLDPSLWFVGVNGPEWVVVRAARYPEKEATMPGNMGEIAMNCARLSRSGNFASVAFANPDAMGAPGGGLWRGHGLSLLFQGLAPYDF